jgi:integrase
MRGLFAWATAAELIREDPTARLTNPYVRKGDGIPPWTEDDVAAYEQRWPIGTHARVWLDVLLYTGLRRGDAVQLGRQHVRDGIISIKTEKTNTPVWLRMLPVLQKTLDAGPCGDLNFVVGETGRPLGAESFGNASAKPAERPVFESRRMACARSRRRARPMPEPPWPSWSPCSAGPAATWHPTTPGPPIGSGLRSVPAISWGTKSENLFPHLGQR